MKKLVTLLFFLTIACFGIVNVHAAYLKDIPVTVTQPDGTVLHCFASGDEFFNYLHDSNGYTIIQHPQTGYYVYADTRDGHLVPTEFIANRQDPASKGLRPYALISPEEWMDRRRAWEVPEAPAKNRDNPNHGTLNNISIFIRFSDDGEFTNTFSSIDNMFNNVSEGAVSMRSYFRAASYGAIEIPTTFYPGHNGETIISYQDNYPRSYFQPYNETTNPNGYQDEDRAEREFALLERAVKYVNANYPVPEDLNIDYDNNGLVDNVCFIVRGDVGGWSSLLWPHQWTLYGRDVTINEKRVWTFNFQLADASGYFNTPTMCHEMNHSLGAPDLYHYSYSGPTPVGIWDLMEGDATPPQHCGAYMKMKYGHWVDEIPEITQAGVYTLHPISSPSPTNIAYKIQSDDPNQFYVLEYRDNTSLFETGLPGSGLLVYRIDTRFSGNASYDPSNGIYDEVYIYRPGGSTSANGNLNNAYFSSDVGRTEFSASTSAYPFLTDGILDYSLRIYNITNAGSTISFTYGSLSDCEPPTDLNASVENNNVTLSWNAVVNARSYNIYRSGTLIGNTSGTTFVDSNLGIGKYPYYLKSVDGNGRLSTASETVTVTIAPEGFIIIGDGGLATNDFLPSYSYYNYALTQQIYSADEIGSAGFITDIAFYNDGGEKNRTYDFYLKSTTKNTFSNATDWEAVTDADKVFSGSVTMAANDWTIIALDTPFEYDGLSNLLLVSDDNSGGWSYAPHMSCHVFRAPSQAIYIYSDDINYDPNNPASYNGVVHTEKNQLILRMEDDLDNFAITAIASPAVGGTITGAGTYSYGQSCTLTATANAGYTFMYWTENGEVVSTEATYSFTVRDDRELVANFTLPITVTAVAYPPEGGTIQGAGEYDYETECSLTAIPNEGYTFVYWTYEGQLFSWSAEISFIVDSEMDRLVANFVEVEFPIIETFENYTVGNKIALEANAAGSNRWTTWSVALGGDEDGVVASLAGAKCAHFTYGNDQVFLLGNVETGTYTISFDMYIPEGKDAYNNLLHAFYGNSGSEWATEVYYKRGTYIQTGGGSNNFDCPYDAWFNVRYEINLDNDIATFYVRNEEIVSWRYSLKTNGSSGACKLSALNFFPPTNADVSEYYLDNLVVTNTATPHMIDAVANPVGSGTIIGTGQYDYGATCTLRALPANEEYTFMYWTRDGELVSTEAEYTFTVTGDRNLVANFSMPLTINAVAIPSEGGTIQGTGEYRYGTECTLTALPNAGYSFMYWTEDSEIVSTDASYSFTVTTARNLEAHFSLSLTITASVGAGEGGSVIGAGEYSYGDQCILKAAANEGYTFVNWTENGEAVSWSVNYIFTVTSDRDLVANFVETSNDVEMLVYEPFEEYTVGNMIATEAIAAGHGWWTTWSSNPGSNEDGFVVNYGGSQCGYISGSSDNVLLLGDREDGVYDLEFDALVPEGKNGYFNVLHHFDGSNSTWAMQAYLHLTNNGSSSFIAPGNGTVHAGSNSTCNLPCVYDEWMHFRIHVDTDIDRAQLYYNEQFMCEWQWSLTSFGENVTDRVLAAMDFYAPMGDGSSEFYIDNFSIKKAVVGSVCHFTRVGKWSDASNWHEGVLPSVNDAVSIDDNCTLNINAEVAQLAITPGVTLTLQSGNTLTVTGDLTNTVAANLVIEDGAQLVNASENVAATVKKNVTAYGSDNPNAWYIIASPVISMPIDSSGFVTPEYDLYRFNETNLTNEEWENYKANLADFTTFENGRGYLYASGNDFTSTFTGILNASAVTIPLTCTERPDDPLSGFNLIGNPFPHNIYKGAGGAIDNANLASGYYTLTNEGTWQVHSFDDAILPGQGILVKANAPTDLTIAKSNAVASSESGITKQAMTISVSGETGTDRVMVCFGQGNGLSKMAHQSVQAPSISIQSEDGEYAIAHVANDSGSLELLFNNNQPGEFMLNFSIDDAAFTYLHLIDKETGNDINLLQQPSYSFIAKGREKVQRFMLVFEHK